MAKASNKSPEEKLRVVSNRWFPAWLLLLM